MTGKRLAAVAALAWALAPAPASAYRYVCNSLDQNGNPQFDSCGPCQLPTAARWDDATLSIVVDVDTLPEGMTAARWSELVDHGADAWSTIEGSALRIERAGTVTVPDFGVDQAQRSVFWVVGDAAAWEDLTLTNAAKTLGLTAGRWQCTEPRRFFDADVALNGTDGAYAWDCDGPGCRSVEYALTHELGHAVGLGHACVDCEWSMMRAVDDPGFEPLLPLADDEDGIRALYPATADGEDAVEVVEAVDAAEPAPDVAEAVDAGGDVTVEVGGGPEGCGCRSGTGSGAPGWPLAGLCLLWLGLRGRRGARGRTASS